MVSVKRRATAFTQPRGGFVNPRVLGVEYQRGAGPDPIDHKIENVHPSLVGMSVDYLTRLARGTKPMDVFAVSMQGARMLGGEARDDAEDALGRLKAGRVDAAAIEGALKLSSFDVAFRNSRDAYNPDAQTAPDAVTMQHVATMVDRAQGFFRTHGPLTMDHLTFRGGYTRMVDTGDGDFLTANTLWDMKVSVTGPTNKHTLQVLMYYLMGKRSVHPEFARVTRFGIYNPRLDTAWSIAVASLPPDTIKAVERDVIGYDA